VKVWDVPPVTVATVIPAGYAGDVGGVHGVVGVAGEHATDPRIVRVTLDVPLANVNVLSEAPVQPPSSPSTGVQFCPS
jgi:hypothetical protein